MRLLNLIFTFKFLPPKKKILIYDKNTSEILQGITNDYNVLYIRDEFYYFLPLIRCFLKLKFSSFEYYVEVIRILDPKIVITIIDNDINFYRLKSLFKNKVFISIQNGHRTKLRSFFSKNKISVNEKLSCDYIFVFNKWISNIYKKFIEFNSIEAGSFRNNMTPVVKKKYKRIVFISQYREKAYFENQEILCNKYNKNFWTEFKVLPVINKFCLYNKIELFIIGNSSSSKEQNFFNKILNKSNYKYIKKKNLNNYKLIDSSELVIFIDSTLGYESLGRKNKTISLSVREMDRGSKEIFFWPKKTNLFDTNINISNMNNEKKIFTFLKKHFYQKREKWICENFFYISNSIKYNKNNLKFKKILKNKLNDYSYF